MCGVVASPKSKSGKSDDAPHADVKIERARRRCCGCICQTCPPPANPVSGDESKTAGSDRVMVEPIDAPGDQSAASGEGISLARRRTLMEEANSLFHLLKNTHTHLKIRLVKFVIVQSSRTSDDTAVHAIGLPRCEVSTRQLTTSCR